ncbi:MAG: PEP-CTERM sorting domain-containing protein [Phycisphaerae bacterium]|nr:PEP-CTERM sorting domain-containing protein [Phycisphaerae bacterium]
MLFKSFPISSSLAAKAGLTICTGAVLALAGSAGTAVGTVTPYLEWNFSNTSGTTVADTGSAASSSYNGTLVGGATVSGGQMATTGTAGMGMQIPYGAFGAITGDFSFEMLSTVSNPASANDGWNTFFNVGGNSSNQSGILVHSVAGGAGAPSAAAFYTTSSDNTGNLSGPVLSSGEQVLVDVTYIASSGLFSFYVNGTLANSTTLSSSEYTDFGNLATFAGTSNSAAYDGVGGFDYWNNLSFVGTTNYFSVYNSALTANQVAANYTAVPETGTLGLLGLGALGLLMLKRRKTA